MRVTGGPFRLESDPLLAPQDSLTTFDAERVLVVVNPDGDSRYLEDERLDEIEQRVDVPVQRWYVTRNGSGRNG